MSAYRYWLVYLPEFQPDSFVLFVNNRAGSTKLRDYSSGRVEVLGQPPAREVFETTEPGKTRFEYYTHTVEDVSYWTAEIRGLNDRSLDQAIRSLGPRAEEPNPIVAPAPLAPERLVRAAPAQPPRLFVSYATPDKAFADALVRALETAGAPCWIAPRDVLPGRDYGASITAAIRTTQVFVLVFSTAANRSKEVLRELALAMKEDTAIVPIRIDDVTPTEGMEYRLAIYQWIEADGDPSADLVGKLVALLPSRDG